MICPLKSTFDYVTSWTRRSFYLQILSQDEAYAADALIDLGPAPPLPDKNDLGLAAGPGVVPGSSSAPPANPQQYTPFNYPAPPPNPGAIGSVPPYQPYPQGDVGASGGLGTYVINFIHIPVSMAY